MTLEISGVSKSFGTKSAVSNLSFRVEEGQVFGLLGLNGAGKSTTIRMILNILSPDTGRILWRGQPTSQHPLGMFGYLPEERGLYQQMKVLPHLRLFGELQGLSAQEAEQSAVRWLERFEIPTLKSAVVGDLSKGNQQKVQFIAAILHNPDLIVLDEPFSGLDPVNTTLFKEIFNELVAAHKTIVFSSHRLDHVEELCHAIAIIHNQHLALWDTVDGVLQSMPPRFLRISADAGEVRALLGPSAHMEETHGLLSIPVEDCDPQSLLSQLVAKGVAIRHFELVRPSLLDVFLEKVGRSA